MRVPKVAIVSTKLITQESRLDAGHYLGYVRTCREELERSRQNLVRARERVRRAENALAAEEARMQSLIDSGDLEIVSWRDV